MTSNGHEEEPAGQLSIGAIIIAIIIVSGVLIPLTALILVPVVVPS